MLNCTEQDGESAGLARRFDTVLILEDDGLLAMMLEDLARDHGATNVLSFAESGEALRVATSEPIDCGVLDISLHGKLNYEVADALAARGIPFLFCTGLTRADIEERHRHRPLLPKPYGDADFKACLALALGR